VFDLRLRHVKERAVSPLVDRMPRAVTPRLLTLTGFILCVAAAAAAWQVWSAIAVACWLACRTLDGLDGAVARHRGTASDLGGYGDVLLDSVGYAMNPLGVAFGADDPTTWTVTAVLIATFYVNSASWLMLSALLEKRAHGTVERGESTSVTMPAGLIEGAETVVIFTVALAVPSIAVWCFGAMAIGVAISVIQRAVAAKSVLA